MSTRPLAKAYFVAVILVAFALTLSACSPAAAPATPAPAQPAQPMPNAQLQVRPPAQPSAQQPPAMSAPTSAPAAQPSAAERQAPGQPSAPAGAAGQPNAMAFPTSPAASASQKACCLPTPIPWPTYPAQTNILTPTSPSSTRARITSRPLRWMSIPRRTPRCATICATARLPPADLIRVEECVNYFKQEYPDPGEGAFSINLEAARSPFSPEGTYLLKVGLQGKHLADWQRKDASLTFVMDVSGSMQEDNKIDMVKYGLTKLVDQLARTIGWRLWPSATTPGSCSNRPRSKIAIAFWTPSTACTR